MKKYFWYKLTFSANWFLIFVRNIPTKKYKWKCSFYKGPRIYKVSTSNDLGLADFTSPWIIAKSTKGRSILFNHFIDMRTLRTTVNFSISCRKNVFLLENFNKNTFFVHEMNKLTVVLKSIKWLNKIERPLVPLLVQE